MFPAYALRSWVPRRRRSRSCRRPAKASGVAPSVLLSSCLNRLRLRQGYRHTTPSSRCTIHGASSVTSSPAEAWSKSGGASTSTLPPGSTMTPGNIRFPWRRIEYGILLPRQVMEYSVSSISRPGASSQASQGPSSGPLNPSPRSAPIATPRSPTPGYRGPSRSARPGVRPNGVIWSGRGAGGEQGRVPFRHASSCREPVTVLRARPRRACRTPARSGAPSARTLIRWTRVAAAL